MPPVSSIHNPRIKEIRALRQRKARAQTGLFFVEGVRMLAEAYQLGVPIELLVIAPALLTSAIGQDVARQLMRSGCACLDVTADVFASLTEKDVAQGVGAVIRQRWSSLDAITPAGGWIALDGVQYPGNLGTILRTSDAVGGRGVILLGSTADPFDPQSLRASVGAIFSQQVARASFADLLAWKQRTGAFLIGTSPDAACDYREVPYPPPSVLLMGCERRGLSTDQQAACDIAVRIPMLGRSDSLNLSVATGLMLYELLDQRRRALRV